ncbi:hypothetical protein QQX10_06355 [Demequina sp. SYSU T00039]|uniref:Uncharacterized protein n=1 Tax=Demequina lignilytica TaxID=3051663 RepID=A0AAW7M4V4_9MICO|nr:MULTISPECIES: hypothetical protein [unclassified Demequina]MDN4477878.1 hypothetical protein [Demequina sp. SYSU T00039-1]MDN4487787.1 hypothetical protein [Demequina sp. SYSU T00039]
MLRTSTPRARRTLIAAASAAALGAVLSGCTSTAGTEASASPTAEASGTGTAAPSEPSAGATSADASSTPEPTPTVDAVASDPPATTPTPAPGESRAQVTVTVTSWGVSNGLFSAGAVVEGVVEDGALCFMTMTKGDRTVTANGQSARSAASSSCGDGLIVDLDDLSSGTWALTIAFRSDTAEGTSAPQEVDIP